MDAMHRTDAELSRDVAQEAGRLLLDLRASFGPVDDKDAANALRKQADQASHVRIMELLTAARPDDAILSEEGKDDASRLDAERVWIVDPLDGTYEYGQGRADFAVHVALWQPAGGILSACTVDLPAQGLTRSVLDAVDEPGGPPRRPTRSASSPRAAVRRRRSARPSSGSRPSWTRPGIAHQGVEVIDVGSVGAKVNEILLGLARTPTSTTPASTSGTSRRPTASPATTGWCRRTSTARR